MGAMALTLVEVPLIIRGVGSGRDKMRSRSPRSCTCILLSLWLEEFKILIKAEKLREKRRVRACARNRADACRFGGGEGFGS